MVKTGRLKVILLNLDIEKRFAICAFFCCIFLAGRSQDGINEPGKYSSEFSVKDCFNAPAYKEGFKPDLVKSNYILKGQRIWRSVSLDNRQNAVILNTNNKCLSVGLFEIIKFGLLEKNLNAFFSDDFSKAGISVLHPAEILASLAYYDSSMVSVFDANGDQRQELSVTKRYIMGSDIKSYLIEEDWILNANSGKTEKHIIAIAPLILDKKTGQCLPLFWLYYAEWKSLFACFEAQNFYSHGIISFDDVFRKQYFISRIDKSSNVFDRSLKSVSHGEDAYMENELLKEKINNIESDLFQY